MIKELLRNGWRLGLALVLLVAGCATPTLPVAPPSAPSPSPPTSATPSAAPLPVLALDDDAGRRVEITVPAERIVALAPNLTEIVFAVGAGEKLVGVSDFSDYPAPAKEIPSVGGFPLNLELIVDLEPDLVLAAGITDLGEVTRLQELGLTVLYLNPRNLEGVLGSILTVGDVVGQGEDTEALVEGLRDRLQEIREMTELVETRPRVYYEIDPTLYSGGPGSFTHELITLAGGDNIASGAASPFPQLSAEEIIAADPEVILFSHAKYGGTAEGIADRPGWETITAVRNGDIFSIDPDLVDRPGPRILDGLETMARILHPDLF